MKTFRNRIHLPNRYGYSNVLVLTRVDDCGTIASYTLELDERNNFIRGGYDPDTFRLDFVDPEGGPFIQRGSQIGRFEVLEISNLDGTYVIKLGV